MTIPLDKLYHYIESVAQDIRGDDVIIYRFFPHGSKKIEDLSAARAQSLVNMASKHQIYCYDQEPLDYDRYSNKPLSEPNTQSLIKKYNVPPVDYNLCVNRFHIYDQQIIIHSEKRSDNVTKYAQHGHFVPVYYWSHAIIARDWFRFAQYDNIKKNVSKKFLIYNRAWSGTREYRLKFIDLLINENLVNQCQVTINPVEPELRIHYSDYTFINKLWKPVNSLEQYVTDATSALSSASADYAIEDYNSTDFEIVLETLFDDTRLHLTEKTLRPIALGQPFLLVATHGSLEYLRSYGFKTFANVIDETYDTIDDPILRLKSVVKVMREIASWTEFERKEKMLAVNEIAAYNRKHFFSKKFSDQVLNELKINLSTAINTIENNNTGSRLIDRRKELAQYPEIKDVLLSASRKDISKVLHCARKYYNKH